MAQALFNRENDRFTPTTAAGSPWSPELLHGGPPTGLLAHCLEASLTAEHMRLARLSVDLLKPVPMAPLQVVVEALRRGRRLQLLSATLLSDGQTVARATGLYLEQIPTQVPEYGSFDSPTLPVPADAPVATLARAAGWMDESTLPGLHATAEAQCIDGIGGEGRGRAWMRLPIPVVADEPHSATVAAATLADFGNGVGQLRLNPRTGCINADVNLHLHRPPAGEWIGFDARSRMEPDGVGLAETTLYDRQGPIGRVMQTLMAIPVYSGWCAAPTR